MDGEHTEWAAAAHRGMLRMLMKVVW